MQLYKLADEYAAAVRNLESLLDAGEIDHGTLSDTMESMVGDVKDKAINVALHIKNLRSDLAQLEDAKASFSARIKAAESAVEFFEQYLDANMKKSGIAELKTAEVLVKYKKLPAIVFITGEVPEGYQRVIPEKREPDKRAIGDALKAGQVLDFAALIEGRTKLEVK